MPYTKVGELLGVSDNAVRKRTKRLNCEMPPPRFHTRTLKFKQELLNSRIK